MKFIAVLAAIAIEHLAPRLDDVRNFAWFRHWQAWLLARTGGQGAWSGPLGVFALLALPLAGAGAVLALLGALGGALAFAGALALLVYSLGPRDLSHQVEEYVTALSVNDASAADAIGADLSGLDPAEASPPAVARAILVLAAERLFSVLFWFVVLGPIGALLYRLAAQVVRSPLELPAAQREAAAFLHGCLAWIPVRLLALGYALVGSLMHALERWQFDQRPGIADNDAVLIEAGLGALQVDSAEVFCALEPANRIVLIAQVKGLVGRALFAWLAIYAALTIAGLAG